MMRSPLLILILVTGVGAKPVTVQPTEPDQTRTRQVSDQPLCYHVTDPDAMNVSLIYDVDKDEHNLYESDDLPLSDCSGSGSVGLDTCRVCRRQEQVLALCHLSNPSADLQFEASDRDTPLRKTRCVFAVPLRAQTSPMVALQSPAAPETAPETAPPGLGPGLTALIVCGVLGGLGVVVFGVVFTQRKKIKSWMNFCWFTSVPPEDQETRTERTSPPGVTGAPDGF